MPEDRNLYNSYFYNAHDNTSVLDKFILHGRQTYQYTDGGSALHCNLEEHLSKEQYLKLIDFAVQEGTLENFRTRMRDTWANFYHQILMTIIH